MSETGPILLSPLADTDRIEVREGALWIEQRRAIDLANSFSTPLYVISETSLRRNVRALRDTFAKHWGRAGVYVLPSIKANHCLALRRILTQEGTGCDTFGASELHAALAGKVPAHLISVNGSAKDASLIKAAVLAGARITLDSEAELHLVSEAAREIGKRATIRLRVRPDYDGLDDASDLLPGRTIRDAAFVYKPGISPTDAERVGGLALTRPELKMTGLMMHLGRHSASIQVWEKAASSFAVLITRLIRSWGDWRPEEIDIGGGYPAPRDPTSPSRSPAPPLDRIASAICTALKNGLEGCDLDIDKLKLEIEPGRSLFADAGVHLTRVRHVKVQTDPVPRRWIETDTTEMFLPDLLIEHAFFPPHFDLGDPQGDQKADIVGISCGFDILAEQVPAPTVSVGDVIAFLDCGAYQDAASSNFNAMPRPGTILVSGKNAEWIKRPETIADVFARDLVPERLQ